MSKRKKKDENPFTGFLSGEVYKVFNKHPHKTFNHKQLAKLIRPLAVEFIKKQIPDYAFIEEIHEELKSGIIGTLNELHAKGDLIETERGSYKLKPQHAYMEGIIDIKPSGTAYLLSENDEDDIEIAPRNVKNALHGDRVKIYLYARHKHKRMEGEVVEVLKRSKTEFVGKVQINGKIAFVVPDSPKMLVDIFIPEDKIGKAIQGQKVVAEMVDWPKGAKNPVGRIKTIIGWPGKTTWR